MKEVKLKREVVDSISLLLSKKYMKKLSLFLRIIGFSEATRLEILNSEMNGKFMEYTVRYVSSTLFWLGIKIKTYARKNS